MGAYESSCYQFSNDKYHFSNSDDPDWMANAQPEMSESSETSDDDDKQNGEHNEEVFHL